MFLLRRFEPCHVLHMDRCLMQFNITDTILSTNIRIRNLLTHFSSWHKNTKVLVRLFFSIFFNRLLTFPEIQWRTPARLVMAPPLHSHAAYCKLFFHLPHFYSTSCHSNTINFWLIGPLPAVSNRCPVVLKQSILPNFMEVLIHTVRKILCMLLLKSKCPHKVNKKAPPKNQAVTIWYT